MLSWLRRACSEQVQTSTQSTFWGGKTANSYSQKLLLNRFLNFLKGINMSSSLKTFTQKKKKKVENMQIKCPCIGTAWHRESEDLLKSGNLWESLNRFWLVKQEFRFHSFTKQRYAIGCARPWKHRIRSPIHRPLRRSHLGCLGYLEIQDSVSRWMGRNIITPLDFPHKKDLVLTSSAIEVAVDIPWYSVLFCIS